MTDRGKVGPWLATALVANSMIGSGIWLLPASLAATGSVTIFSWVAAALAGAAFCGVFAALVLLNPGTGNLFSHIAKAFGPGAGFVFATLFWTACWIATVAVAITVAGYLGVFIPAAARPPGLTIAALLVVWLFVGINLIGPKLVARIAGLTLIVGLAPVVLIAFGGWFAFHPHVFLGSWNVSGHPALAVVPRATVKVFWAFLGVEAALVLAPRVRDPQRNVPIATFAGFSIAACIYIGACTAIMGMLPAAELAKSTAPFAAAVVPLLGAAAAGTVALFAMLKACGTEGTCVLLTVETADGEAMLGQTRAAARAAHRASRSNLLLTGLLASVVVLASTSPTLIRQFTIVTNVSVVLVVSAYGAAALALFRLSDAAVPARRFACRALASVGALFSVLLIASSEPGLLIWSAGTALVAIAAYVPVRRRRLGIARAAAPQNA